MSDLTQPPHVPSCVSTGEGVTVPTATATPSDKYPPACEATPATTLREQIMNSNYAKNEREWWAARHIATLERELSSAQAALAEAKEEVARLDNLRVSAENYAADFRKERDQPCAALDVAKGALNEIQECADAIKRNLREDIAPALRDNIWVITAACHATVIQQALARIAEARKGQP